jgi:ubiquinone/menaquinone biosynthesis C-methylase UbiE
MLEEARRLNPQLAFRQGNMLALELPDNSLAGIVAFYAIVHLPRAALPRAFREMARVLKSSGRLLLSHHIGEERFIGMSGGIARSTSTSTSFSRKASSAI